MMQVRNTMDLNARPAFGDYVSHLFSIFVPAESFALAARGIGVFLLVIGTVLGGGLFSAQAFRDAAPGDSFYNMKLAVERVQLTLAPNDDYRTRLHTEFADRRLDEIARLAEEPESRQLLAPSVLANFDRDVAALKTGLEKLRAEDPSGVVETAKLMERKMAVYQNILRKAGDALPPSSQLAVAGSRDLVDGVTIAAMSVIVEKHLAGDLNAPKTVVDRKFDDRIRQAEDKIEAATKDDGQAVETKTSQAKAAIAEARELIKNENYQAALSKIVEVAELTKEVEAEAQKAEDQTPAAPAEDCPKTADGQPSADCPKTTSENVTTPVNTSDATAVPAGSPETSGDAAGSGSR